MASRLIHSVTLILQYILTTNWRLLYFSGGSLKIRTVPGGSLCCGRVPSLWNTGTCSRNFMRYISTIILKQYLQYVATYKRSWPEHDFNYLCYREVHVLALLSVRLVGMVWMWHENICETSVSHRTQVIFTQCRFSHVVSCVTFRHVGRTPVLHCEIFI